MALPHQLGNRGVGGWGLPCILPKLAKAYCLPLLAARPLLPGHPVATCARSRERGCPPDPHALSHVPRRSPASTPTPDAPVEVRACPRRVWLRPEIYHGGGAGAGGGQACKQGGRKECGGQSLESAQVLMGSVMSIFVQLVCSRGCIVQRCVVPLTLIRGCHRACTECPSSCTRELPTPIR